MRPGRADYGPERADSRSDRAYSRSERLDGGGNARIKLPYVVQDLVTFRTAAQKSE